MKNKRLSVCIKGLLLAAFASGNWIAINPPVALGATVQDSRFNETPDPYYQPPRNSKTTKTWPSNQSGFETLKPNPQPSNLEVQTQRTEQQTPPQDLWNAPLTPVRIAQPPTKSSPGQTKQPTAKLTGNHNSIIREKPGTSTNKNNALAPIGSGNSFAPPTNTKNNNAKDPGAVSNDFSPFGFPTPKSSGGNATNPKPDQFPPLATKPKSSETLSANPTDPKASIGGTDSIGFGFGKSGGAQSSALTQGSVAPKQTTPAGLPKSGIADKPEAFEPSKVVALVGGEPIFVGDLMFEINQLLEQYMPQAPESVKERERKKMIPQLLPKFVEQKMLFLGTIRQLPPEADIEAILEQAGKEFDEKALDKMIENSGLKSVAEFDAHLRVQGSSIRKLRRAWSVDQLTKYFLSQQLKVKTEVTHQEMLDSYRENYESYAVPARCRWEQVMIRFDRSPSRDAARKKLGKLHDDIVYGANLQAVAKNESHGFRADEGGQHDWTSRGSLVLKELDKALFSLKIGDLSQIIETRDGFHIVRVLERTEATHKPFLEAQVEIKERILNEKRNAAFQKHVTKLKDEIPVEYLLNEGVTPPNAPKRTASR